MITDDYSILTAASPSSILENEEVLFSILNFCDEVTRFNFITLSSKHYKLLMSNASFKWRLECLHREKGLYHPLELPNSSTTWKEIFLCNFVRRNMWENDKRKQNGNNPNEEDSKFHIQVSARFKPKSGSIGRNDNHCHYEKKVALPLYQRLALIRMNRKLQTRKEAFEVLFQQGGWFGKDMQERYNSDDKNSDDFCLDQEKNRDEGKEEGSDKSLSLRGGVHMIDIKNNSAVLVDPIKGLRKFDFDNVFNEYSTQEELYKATTMPLISEFINGFNVSCIVYGQTGSGKTHTMYGNDIFKIDKGMNGLSTLPASWGIVPRSCHEILKAVKFREENLNFQIDTEIAISYIEIYGDSVTDLLREGKSCGNKSLIAQRYVLDGSSEVKIASMSDVLKLLNDGEKQKRKAATAMNQRSSRAHSVFIVRMKQTCPDTGVSYTSRLFLADLGGSEQLKKSQAFSNEGQEQRELDRKQRTREAVNINLGLLSLKQCVEALRKKDSFVPYTTSKLTMMLSTGLGGDSKTAVIVCGAQEQRHGAETIAAMKFGHVCRGISNSVKTTTNMLQELLQNIDDQIYECEENIKKHERWEVQEVNKNGTKEEGRYVSVVTGAEQHREKLAVLIQQKLELTGETPDELYNDLNVIEGFGNAHVYGLGQSVQRY